MNTEIRVQYLNPCSIYAEPYWVADLVENGERVWADCYGRSTRSADEARQQLLAKLDGGRSVFNG